MQNEILGKIWEYLKPVINLPWEYAKTGWENFVIFLRVALVFISEITQKSKEMHENAKPLVIGWAQENPLLAAVCGFVALIVTVFWLWILRHVIKKESVCRKTWAFVILISGPVGALIYFFARKRVLEKKEKQHEKVMFSFFTPMGKRIKK
ncbi:MAG TPA: PLDc N-terminal domain-containing protein [Candidatus Moranbacteria bacterium]|nr:PLDc N-terminal domain-containing protein [Candidatus Moranbacteria bacterium]HPX94380.1 PLDc N-terminal domain-containing protein [Candidatus Moranbacteria bacterium]HQB59509.1 PLDc N-terminal domain-containing protein [Candidatus Moranbacteria bacterium]